VISLDTRLENFLGIVSFVADKKQQYAMWVKHSQGVSSVISLNELYCQFFDDNDIDNFIEDELNTSPLTSVQRDAIRSFRDALNSFSKTLEKMPQPMSDAGVIENPEWNELVKLAQFTLTVFSK
jgi:hypothetical protein